MKQTNSLILSGVNPYRVLVAAIFDRAIKDSRKDDVVGQDAKDFLESDYATVLLQMARLDGIIQ